MSAKSSGTKKRQRATVSTKASPSRASRTGSKLQGKEKLSKRSFDMTLTQRVDLAQEVVDDMVEHSLDFESVADAEAWAITLELARELADSALKSTVFEDDRTRSSVHAHLVNFAYDCIDIEEVTEGAQWRSIAASRWMPATVTAGDGELVPREGKAKARTRQFTVTHALRVELGQDELDDVLGRIALEPPTEESAVRFLLASEWSFLAVRELQPSLDDEFFYRMKFDLLTWAEEQMKFEEVT